MGGASMPGMFTVLPLQQWKNEYCSFRCAHANYGHKKVNNIGVKAVVVAPNA